RVGVAEREGGQRPRWSLHLQDGDIGRRVDADDLRLQALVVREADLDLPRALDNVVVGDDVTGFVNHEARAERLLPLPLGQVERVPEQRVGRELDEGGRRDLDDAGSVALVDLVDRERLRLSERDAGGARWRGGLDLAERGGLAAE